MFSTTFINLYIFIFSPHAFWINQQVSASPSKISKSEKMAHACAICPDLWDNESKKNLEVLLIII